MKTLLRQILLAVAMSYSFAAAAQESRDTTRIVHNFPSEHSYFGLDVGVDLSDATQVRFGFSTATQFAGCAGWGAGGHALGISFRPESNTGGVYGQVWATVFMLNIGLKAAYETNLHDKWATLQPQIGLGVGLLRVTYNYAIPFGLDDRALVPRHSLGVAYTFPMAEH